MKNTNQTAILLKHFETQTARGHKPSISGVEAQAIFRIRSLSRRINDMEREGYEFHRERCKDTTGQRYVRYHFLGKRTSDVQMPFAFAA